MVNPDLTILLKRVNRGEDLRWVGSRCPLTHALGIGFSYNNSKPNQIIIGYKFFSEIIRDLISFDIVYEWF